MTMVEGSIGADAADIAAFEAQLREAEALRALTCGALARVLVDEGKVAPTTVVLDYDVTGWNQEALPNMWIPRKSISALVESRVEIGPAHQYKTEVPVRAGHEMKMPPGVLDYLDYLAAQSRPALRKIRVV